MRFIVSGCLLAAWAALIAGCHSDQITTPVAMQTVPARVVTSEEQQAPINVSATGTLHAREMAVLSAQVVGRVQQVLVREGDSVKAGQTLVILDDSTLRASAEQADAAVKAAGNQQAAAQTNSDLAASTLARYQKLEAEKSVSPQEMDEVTRRAQASAAQVDALKAQESAAKAQATGAHAMLEYAHIRAPFAGVIAARMVDPGALAAPGVPLLGIDSTGPLQLQSTVDESILGAIRLGMRIPVQMVGTSAAPVNGTVAVIMPAADPSSHTFLVKIDLAPSSGLRAGMYGTAQIQTGTRRAVRVPASAVVLRGSLACAYVLDQNGMAQLRYLTLGATEGHFVEVLSGISGGERLVDEPGDRDLAGKRIEVQP